MQDLCPLITPALQRRPPFEREFKKRCLRLNTQTNVTCLLDLAIAVFPNRWWRPPPHTVFTVDRGTPVCINGELAAMADHGAPSETTAGSGCKLTLRGSHELQEWLHRADRTHTNGWRPTGCPTAATGPRLDSIVRWRKLRYCYSSFVIQKFASSILQVPRLKGLSQPLPCSCLQLGTIN